MRSLRLALLLGLTLTLGLLAGPGTASARGRPRARVALLPLEAINLTAAEGTRYQALLVRAVRALPEVALEERQVPVAANCAAELTCLRDVGALLGVEKLLALRVGRLGETTVVRLSAFDVSRGARQGTWQEVLRRGDDAAVLAAVERILAGLFPRTGPPPRAPWYTRWWVWTAASVVVAGTVTAVVLATRPGQREPDVSIRFP